MPTTKLRNHKDVWRLARVEWDAKCKAALDITDPKTKRRAARVR